MLFEELSLSKSIQKPFTNKAITSYTNTRKSIPLVLAEMTWLVVLKLEQENSGICNTNYTSFTVS
jgi:hypothetical protein